MRKRNGLSRGREVLTYNALAIRGLRRIRKQTHQSFVSCSRFSIFRNPVLFTRSLNAVPSQPLLQIRGLTSSREAAAVVE
jgi:hypothetical protein